jgi:molybdopterin-guanine dinucleotide biosynthesis protein A
VTATPPIPHPRLSGILLVGGSSRRFGSPKALARLGGETLAERAWRLLGEVCDEQVAVGKTNDRLILPFPVVDDESPIRAPIAGVVAGLRAAGGDKCVVLPVDCPFVTADGLRRLADTEADVAVPPTGPLPGVYRRVALPVLERSLARGELSLRRALEPLDVAVVELDAAELVNVNTRADLRRQVKREDAQWTTNRSTSKSRASSPRSTGSGRARPAEPEARPSGRGSRRSR